MLWGILIFFVSNMPSFLFSPFCRASFWYNCWGVKPSEIVQICKIFSKSRTSRMQDFLLLFLAQFLWESCIIVVKVVYCQQSCCYGFNRTLVIMDSWSCDQNVHFNKLLFIFGSLTAQVDFQWRFLNSKFHL